MAKKKSARKKAAPPAVTQQINANVTDELAALVDEVRGDESRSKFAARALAMLALKLKTGKWPTAIREGLLSLRGQGERGPDSDKRAKRSRERGKDKQPRSDGRWKGKRKSDQSDA